MTTFFSRPDPFAEEYASEPIRDPVTGVPTPSATGFAETVEDMAARLLDLVVQAALSKGVTLPTRQFYYPAPIPADCEQVVVMFSQLSPTPIQDTGSTVICKPWRWLAPFSVAITRCTPAVPMKGKNLRTVSVASMQAAARIASDDMEVCAKVVDMLGEIGPDCTVAASAPSGGMQTVELNVPLISGGSL